VLETVVGGENITKEGPDEYKKKKNLPITLPNPTYLHLLT
jgi:hypothetical protein